ncbi:MAG: hypothetical protein HY508_08720 [Acidobacteria bacterium]|nr:hypothetical protein [Acidobacteriota bacterium]
MPSSAPGSAFAEPRANGLLPPVAEDLSKRVDAFKGKENDRIAANDYNIAAIARFFRGLPMHTVIPPKSYGPAMACPFVPLNATRPLTHIA